MNRLPSSQLGNVMRQLAQTFNGFATLLGRGRTNKRGSFEIEAQAQLVKLKEKGLSIPVFTL